MVTKIKSFLLKPTTIAFVLSLLVIWFLPDIFSKYQIELVESGTIDNKNDLRIYSYDMDGDGFSEKILSFEHNGNHSLQLITYDGGIIEQWNTDGIIAGKGERLTVGDYDEDGYNEIYTYYQRGDSVFHYCIEPLDTISPIKYENKLITTLSHQYL